MPGASTYRDALSERLAGNFVILRVGAHVSSSGGLWTAVDRAAAIEAEAIQIFPSAPQNWRPTNHTDEAYARFKAGREAAGIEEVWVHCIYLPNLATDNPEQLQKSIDSVINALTVAHRAEARGVVLHTGSHKGSGIESVLPQVSAALTHILDEAPGDAVLALENAAGHGGVIGKEFRELGVILREVSHPRLHVCVDTCHAFAAGYNLADKDGLEEMLDEFDREIGLEHLVVWHLNDSKMGLGGLRDRHENIGDGQIGNAGFLNWLEGVMRRPEIPATAMLLEVPGIEDNGPDLENVRRVKALRERALATAGPSADAPRTRGTRPPSGGSPRRARA